MRIHSCRQGTEEWEQLRHGRATASQFHRIVTPAKLQPAAGAITYAAELVAQRKRIDSPPPPPTYWMERGTELEPIAIKHFEREHGDVQPVGFILPHVDKPCSNHYGGSPDGLTSDGGIVEIKCPAPETMIGWLWKGQMPQEHRIQCQANLWISGLPHCWFYAWHPEIDKPLKFKIVPDEKVFTAFETAIPEFLELVRSIESTIVANPQAAYRSREIELEGFEDEQAASF